jgi:hypothetical protein
MLQMALGVFALAMTAPPASGYSWSGIVTITGVTHEPPAGYHPYTATMTLRLLEGDRVAVAGGFRVPLFSHGSRNAAQTSVHQADGLTFCSGRGEETLPSAVIGYLEARGGRMTYHLALPRAYAAFLCGENHASPWNRVVVIGRGDPESAEIETEDSVVRVLEDGDTLMKGTFEATMTRSPNHYEYSVRWLLTRRREP